MAATFHSPSFRAGNSDLTIAISPLGLVELADEEFEVHGPRLNRYAHNWAFYLGHHWGYRREVGEAQLTFNYTKALSDYVTNFTFGKGVTFRTPQATEAILPQALEDVWTVDNDKDALLWEIGNVGSVSGDVFVKVAYEDPYVDSAGLVHEGKVRIIPLNPAFCFPEFHPHDRNRIIRFKLKYRFWGTSLEGTRQVFTYTELLTDNGIEEYVNDEMIDQRENPLGCIPIVHIPNIPVASSPWGLSDIQDILPLNRQYNEVATDVSDIINYHAAPVTVITGAKASQLEKGPKKVWGGLPKDASVFNLELGAGLEGPLAFMDLLKRSMHELTGVPEGALGQMQPISNTSGVALAITYQPMMNRYNLKRTRYAMGLEAVNALVIKTLFLYKPEALVWEPTRRVPLKDGQYSEMDPSDPVSYRSKVHFPPPLPIDQLIKLNEIQGKMALGLESKRGALRELGEEFPDEKLQELFNELLQDAKEQGALDMMQAQIASAIYLLTGVPPEGMESPAVSTADGSEVGAGGAGPLPGPMTLGNSGQDATEMINEITTLAYGTKIPQRRNPDNTNTGEAGQS
jgi:hypothetical protein